MKVFVLEELPDLIRMVHSRNKEKEYDDLTSMIKEVKRGN
jgi:hypothetical protein